MITHLSPGVVAPTVASPAGISALTRSAQAAATLVQPQNVITAIFSPDGRKVAFVARCMIDPLKAHTLLEWGNRVSWVCDRRLAKKWGVSFVLADPNWAASQLAMHGDTVPTGINFAFLP